jgi:mannose-1-phosphate guanylyltransferase/mannose-6-phosphate isomerase
VQVKAHAFPDIAEAAKIMAGCRAMDEKITPIIVCGGQGTRLWPVSRRSLPKQFAAQAGECSTFQNTAKRVRNPDLFERPVIIAADEHRFIVKRQLELIGCEASILLEPEPRESGPAMLAAALFHEHRRLPGGLLLFLAADHSISPIAVFEECCRQAMAAAKAGSIVMFGVTPAAPETRYGYIQPGEALNGAARRASAFVEKPGLEQAKACIAEGWLWNSGNFLADRTTLIEEYARQAPGTVEAVRLAVRRATADLGFIRLEAESFAKAEKRSFDHAVMEHTEKGAVAAAEFSWSDLGTWDAYWQAGAKDGAGNVFSSPTEAVGAEGCFTLSEDALVTLVGVRDIAVVATRDAVLVADRARSNEVKPLVEQMKRANRPQAETHQRSYRPWGWYQVLDAGSRFQVKRIVVYPSGRLSLQKHFHRAEHWIVVCGTALVTHGETQILLRENESTFIPLGHVHRLENPGKIDLELIEVQSGSYLGEDDIVRFEDQYARE